MRTLLFGSRASGTARPDSDWDMAIVDDALLKKIPRPWPFIDPRNTQVGNDMAARMRHFYTLWQAWSLQTLEQLGGDDGVRGLKERARRAAAATYPEIGDGIIDLFLYTPTQLDPKVWAIRLTLDNRWALKEMGEAGKPFAILEYMKRPPMAQQQQHTTFYTGLP